MRQVHTRLVTGQQMAAIDRRAISGGIAGADLMEAAGRGVIQVLQESLESLSGRSLVVLCGHGNNGGDGFVVARHAHRLGARVRAFLFSERSAVQGDAAHHLGLTESSGVPIEPVLSSTDLQDVHDALSGCDLAVDGLLGTGISGAARGIVAEGILALESAGCPVLAIDVPSGLNADTGMAEGPCAAAGRTVTFAQPKRGHLFYPGRFLCGQLHLVDIGIPADAVDAEEGRVWWNAACGGGGLLPGRKPDAHKGDCGRVLILAGSQGFTGAAALAARGALRGGAGLVTVGVPESLNDVLEVKLTEAMTFPLPEVRKPRCLALRARGDIRRLLSTADVVAVGPGLGRHRETAELVRHLISDIRVPLVLDADGLNAFEGQADRVKACEADTVLTPHPGEYSRLTGTALDDVQANPLDCALKLAADTGAWVVLKGAPTVIGSPEGEGYVNPSGNAGMAAGGTGDILTGLIASLIAQGLPVGQAACLGVYWHGLAGDLGAEELGQAGLLANDVAEALPRAEKSIRNGTDIQRYLKSPTAGTQER